MIKVEEPEIQFAVNVVRQSVAFAKQIQAEMVKESISTTKKDKSPVTVADFAVQALVGHYLSQEFSDAVLVGEEKSDFLRSDGGGDVLEQVCHYLRAHISNLSPESVCQWIDVGAQNPSKRFWTLDPIDGTKGFLREEQYAVALALIEDGRVVFGVLGCPHLEGGSKPQVGGAGSLIIAKHGEGCWWSSLQGDSWTQMNVSKRSEPKDVCILRSVEAAHTNSGQMDSILQEMGTPGQSIYLDSQAKYAVVAGGVGDLFAYLLLPEKPDFRMKIWDVAAGSIVVEEAGGKITDLRGGTLDFGQGKTLAENPGILITNGAIHKQVLQAISNTKTNKTN